ncbi:GntR family transcriptional regulator [Klenkia terrae]|uniref:GntR family transcriptional regulator n=1 Tax=Klenkia terrae TaxID=1052259 RepID=UPI00361ED8FE
MAQRTAPGQGVRTRAEQLAADLGERLATASPGDPVGTIESLRAETGYAYSTVSEAVRLLRDRGLLQIRPGRGVGCSPPTAGRSSGCGTPCSPSPTTRPPSPTPWSCASTSRCWSTWAPPGAAPRPTSPSCAPCSPS